MPTISSLVTAAVALSPSITPGVYFIKNTGSGTVIDIASGNGGVLGWKMHSYAEPTVSRQLWIINPVDSENQVYQIRNVDGTHYLDIPNGNPATGTPVVSSDNTGQSSINWQITPAPDSSGYVIRNNASNTYVDLYLGGSANGTAINGWAGGPPFTNTHQLWDFQSA
ncbi:carbohydrate-binding module family 13 protein [Phlebiopsis gigantea 11061_1 CR5-6]|uniref:Carbohydrate-binding module family 13 protein n=1 Tax=Phlebiopsis gigantea (strain 11061_1 CR5-6) TaxID=745531 RepID=A0A0C3SFJ7_PHLG1|nr:carbohydrate-binding module family 13 protein [Phlebiopsis gigantea 11061_1 CR5-6]